jgi:hypothetical protein
MNKLPNKSKNSEIYNFLHVSPDKKERRYANADEFFITDVRTASNDVFHIRKSDVSLKDIVLPPEIQSDIENIVFEQMNSDFFDEL